MNTPTYTTTVADRIAAARASWAEKLQAKAEIERKQLELDAQIGDQLHKELLGRLSQHLEEWMLEYVQREVRLDHELGIEFATLALPGCCPIVVGNSVFDDDVSYEVRRPLRIECDDFWWVRTGTYRCDDLDQAVDMAALDGESYHEMVIEAARRNEQGLTLSDLAAPPPPDNVDKLGELLAAYTEGKRVATGHISRDDATIFAAGLYAIADQLRRIADAQEASHE